MTEEEFYEALGGIIRERRKAKGWTQKQLGMLAGIHRVSVTQIELAKIRVSLPRLFDFAMALDCQVADLIPRVDQ